jgi:hypothetical protein
MCSESDEAYFNVVRLWTKERFAVHVRDNHPGLDVNTLWAFPAPWKAARG